MNTKNQYRILKGVPLEQLPAYIEKNEADGWQLFQIIMGMVPVNHAGALIAPGDGNVQMIAVAYPLMVRVISAELPGKNS